MIVGKRKLQLNSVFIEDYIWLKIKIFNIVLEILKIYYNLKKFIIRIC